MRNGVIGVVKYLASHEYPSDGVIAYVEIDDKCYMINVAGLKKGEEISVDDMRSQLKAWCNDRMCESGTETECPLFQGYNCMFTLRDRTSDDEIRAAYEIVFK